MFAVHGDGIEPSKKVLQTAIERLPIAHSVARHHAVTHLHGKASQALKNEDVDDSALSVFNQKGVSYLGIERSNEGDALFDHEFGTADKTPAVTIRKAIRDNYPVANAVYNNHLWRGLGL